MNGVLTYNYGSLQSWINQLNSKELATPCVNTGILHGSYDQGSNPTAQIFGKKKNEINLLNQFIKSIKILIFI